MDEFEVEIATLILRDSKLFVKFAQLARGGPSFGVRPKAIDIAFGSQYQYDDVKRELRFQSACREYYLTHIKDFEPGE